MSLEILSGIKQNFPHLIEMTLTNQFSAKFSRLDHYSDLKNLCDYHSSVSLFNQLQPVQNVLKILATKDTCIERKKLINQESLNYKILEKEELSLKVLGSTSPSTTVTSAVGSLSFSGELNNDTMVVAYKLWKIVNGLQDSLSNSNLIQTLDGVVTKLSNLVDKGIAGKLSLSDANFVNELPSFIGEQASSIWSQKQEAAFWTSVKTLFKKVVEVAKAKIATFEEKAASLENYFNMFLTLSQGQQLVEEAVKTIQQQVNLIVSTAITPGIDVVTYGLMNSGNDILQILSDLKNTIYDNLKAGTTPSALKNYSEELKSYINTLLEMPLSNTYSLGFFMGIQESIYQLRNKLAENQGIAERADIVSTVGKITINDYFSTDLSDPITKFKDSLNNTTLNPTGAQQLSCFDQVFFVRIAPAADEYEVDSKVSLAIYKSLAKLQLSKLQAHLVTQEEAKTKCNTKYEEAQSTLTSDYQSKLQGIQEKKNLLQGYQSIVDVASAGLNAYDVLASKYQSLMINNFIPKQDRYLNSMVHDMNYAGVGMDLYNQLRAKLPGVVSAVAHYNLSNCLNQANTQNITSAFDVTRSALTASRRRIYNDLVLVDDALRLCNQLIINMEDDVKFGSLEKNQLIMELTNMKYSLTAAADQGTKLYNFVNLLSITGITDKTKTNIFNVEGPAEWPYALPFLEQQFITGNKKQIFEGGISTIGNLLQSGYANYADQGQAQQLTLNLEVNAVQQEWTIITTGLHLLGRLYMTLASKFKCKRSH
ncbi:CT620/CT621 family type III secretion system effector [Candidatus Clavichlamydia salmonicola]|uniref:CT620/CT621 family type III secretion system effector n=1 Tax=Candidatus Clavichlamydia salmonicola TaxID=469812 RepID=UPI0018912F9C|nr:CT620/CT621 family type III secretion system effector [Candidatus Clavichlamydia salmonicola]